MRASIIRELGSLCLASVCSVGGDRVCRLALARSRGCAVTTGRPDDPNQALEDELRALVTRLEKVPDDVTKRAREAAEGIAAEDSHALGLAYDSVLDATLGPFRPGESLRVLSFAGDGLRVDVRIEAGDSGATLIGWSAPVRASVVALQTKGEPAALAVQPDGTFRARDLARGPFRLHIEVELDGARRNFYSSWFT